MARKRKTSLFEDLLDMVAMMPWWIGITIAVVGYFVLHKLATPSPVVSIQPGQLGSLMSKSIIAGMATAGQYVVPLIGVFGALMSVIRRKQRSELIANVAQSKSANALDGMSWRDFEKLVGEAFRLQGYRIKETGGAGADGGIDLVLTKGDEISLVQCKQGKAYKVSVNVVRELYGVMAAKGATGGFVVTSGRFTDDAKAFAEGRNVQLVDGPRLFEMIKRAKQSLTDTAQQPPGKPTMAQSKAAIEPMCPQCGSSMVKRTARKGGNAGGEFWGCSKFPTCKGVRQLG